MNPKVTVLMPVYNCEKYLRESIESILNQTFKDFEFLIINDGSSDKSAEIVESYKDNRINFVQNEKNIGLAASLNRGLDIAKGEYIARMDADDISLPERLEKQVRFMETNPQIGICGSWIKIFGDINYIGKYTKSHKNIISSLFTTCPLAHPTVIFRKELFNQYNLRYNPDFIVAQDYELWARASKHIVFENIQEVLLNYRTNPNQLIGKNSTLDNENVAIWKKLLENLEFSFTDEDLDFHKLMISERYFIKNPDDFLKQSNEWFDKIISANNIKQIYDPNILDNLFKHKWYVAFKNINEFNTFNISEMITHPQKFKYLNFNNKMRFFYKFYKQKLRSCFK